MRHAVLEAAADLMASQGASASLRDIATAAGVNLGLIHRHFGNKADLRRAVLTYLGELQREQLEGANGSTSIGDLFSAAQADDRNWKIQVRALLGGESITDVQDTFPVVEGLLRLAVEGAEPGTDLEEIRFRVGRTVATAIGWLILEPFLMEALGIEASREEFRMRLVTERARDLNLPD